MRAQSFSFNEKHGPFVTSSTVSIECKLIIKWKQQIYKLFEDETENSFRLTTPRRYKRQ